MPKLTRRQVLAGALTAPSLAACGGALSPATPDVGPDGGHTPAPDDTSPSDGAGSPSASTSSPAPDAPKEAPRGPLARPGVVVEVAHGGAVVNHEVQAAPVRQIATRGMLELTGKATEVEAWSSLFSPGDVVAIKVNPFGYPKFFSQVATVSEIIRGLNLAGIPNTDIVIYDRYSDYLAQVGYPALLPSGVRFAGAVQTTAAQTDLDGYDGDVYVEDSRVDTGLDPSVAVNRRSHLSSVVSKDVTKVVNVPVLKSHWTAGVTAALKNMTYGLVNNTARTHTADGNWTADFIPMVAALDALRQKVVLHVADLLVACYDGGPEPSDATFDYGALLFATDPVTLDRICWGILDDQRAKMGLAAVATLPNREPQYILRCGEAGLGVADLASIQHTKIAL